MSSSHPRFVPCDKCGRHGDIVLTNESIPIVCKPDGRQHLTLLLAAGKIAIADFQNLKNDIEESTLDEDWAGDVTLLEVQEMEAFAKAENPPYS